jgi:heptosyltransferase-1
MILDRSRILIVKPSSLGDVVHTLPVVHALKRHRPSCYIGWIVQKSLAAILEGDSAIDEIIPISIPSTSDPLAARGALARAAVATLRTLNQLHRRFRNNRFDLVLDLHASFRSGLMGTANPKGARIGFSDAKELNTLFQHRTISPDPGKPHAVDRNLLFAHYLGCPPVPKDFRVVTSPEARERVQSFLEAEGVTSTERLIYANPAARWNTKLWTVQAWSQLGDLFAVETGATVVFAGSPADRPYILSVTRRMKSRAVIAAGKLGLAEAVALLEASRVYVGVDSGPMHIAAFTGTPVVALFGPTDPAKVGPYGPGHRVIRVEGLDCLACRKRSCANRRCMEEISPEQALRETADVMGW